MVQQIIHAENTHVHSFPFFKPQEILDATDGGIKLSLGLNFSVSTLIFIIIGLLISLSE